MTVAVAVTKRPLATATGKVVVKLTLPAPSVVTWEAPRKVCPSPKPDGSSAALAKNSRRKLVLGVLLREPPMVVEPPALSTWVSTGKFWRLLGPVSASPGSLGAGWPPPREMPRLALAKMEFALSRLPVLGGPEKLGEICTPSPPLTA